MNFCSIYVTIYILATYITLVTMSPAVVPRWGIFVPYINYVGIRIRVLHKLYRALYNLYRVPYDTLHPTIP